MSVLDRLKDGVTNKAALLPVPDSMNRGAHGATLVGWGIDKAERIVASSTFGFIKGYYREKGLVGGVLPIDILAGGVLTLLSGGLLVATEGKSALGQHLARVGDAGVMSFFNSLGASWGAQAANYQVAVLPATTKLPPGAAPMVLGALPQATGGTYLTAEEIAKYSAVQG